MGFLDKMKSVFLEEEEESQRPAASPSAAGPSAVNAPVAMQAEQPIQMQPLQGSGKINPELLKTFESALKEFNLPGPDYLELKSIIDNENFRKNIPDEKQRILSAFFSIQAGNPSFSKEIVANSLGVYINKMEQERQRASKEFEQRVEEEINGPMASIEQKRQRIGQLQAEIDKIQQEIGAGLQDIENRRAALNSKKMDFDVTIEALIGELKSDMVKIDSAIN